MSDPYDRHLRIHVPTGPRVIPAVSRMCVLLAWAAAALHAAMLNGTVVESGSSKPLSGAQVVVEQIGDTAGGAHSIRTGRNGSFEFPSLPAGVYVIKASRRGFMPMEYGQKRWNSAGTPVDVPESGLSVTLRLPRYGGITGTIVDENDVGWLEGDVLAYRYVEGQPPVLAGRGRSDERGVYRISGLEPGMYLVRSAPMQTEDASYLPTFSKEAVKAEESRPVEVYLEQDTAGVDVRPAEGRLFTLTGSVGPIPPGVPVTVTLVSDMGRLTSQGSLFRFTGLAPALYEIYAETSADPPQVAYQNLGSLTHDSGAELRMFAMPDRRIDVSPSPPGGTPAVQFLARRKDLAGVGEPEALHVADNRTPARLGRWELMLIPPIGYYVSEFSGGPLGRGAASRPEGWNEVTSANAIRFTLSSGGGAVHGVVKSSGQPSAGAPVYLEAYDPAARRRVTDLRATRTDQRGQYRFEGLAPGVYRILSTFEYRSPDTAQMEMAGAQSVAVAQAGDLTADLDLYEIR